MAGFDDMWDDLMMGNQFSEPATLVTEEGAEYTVIGIFCSGTYKEEAVSKNAPVRFVQEEHFMLALNSIPESMRECPWESFRNTTLTLDGRGHFRVYDVSGRMGGTLTLKLQLIREEAD